MKLFIKLFLLTVMLTGAVLPAHAALRVFACEPEWGALAEELGGDQVDVYTATSALQDPHHIQARPSLIARVRGSALVIATGAQLEIGWLPVLLRQSANADVQPGHPGYFEAASYVRLLDAPALVDRSQGDVHPGGNPHIQSDARNMLLVAEALNSRFQQLDPEHAAGYQRRYQDFSRRWHEALDRWQKMAAPLHGLKLIGYHKGWSYMLNWLSMQQVATIEPLPGIEPSPSYLSILVEHQQADAAVMVIYATCQSAQASAWLAKRLHIPLVELPFTVGGNDQSEDLFALYDDTIERLLKASGH
ncbi:MAG: zinc ABC transporter substrate-binding protein [Zetaproteobacteria bacterium CG23_combo_of_CG06-09_8_20_14_all_54_7]|nr:MAG: zinc ABC transporter substrate-binding protein [Zetaproteobacteria bacterium CG23_combo_of_CG06-09_8_20_14_all_54_7]